MEKGIKKILSRLKLEYAFLWAAVIVLVILYEGEVLPSGTFVEDAQAVYILQSAAILLTLGLIPLSLRLFTLSVCRNIRNYLPADALKSYRRWSEIRLALLITPLLFDISVYYATMNLTVDPIILNISEILKIEDHISYYINHDFSI